MPVLLESGLTSDVKRNMITLELKREFAKELKKEIIAFVNTKGGRIMIQSDIFCKVKIVPKA